jgi:hypothetical protein
VRNSMVVTLTDWSAKAKTRSNSGIIKSSHGLWGLTLEWKSRYTAQLQTRLF